MELKKIEYDPTGVIVNEYNEYVREVFSAVGDIVIKSMMGGYLV